MWWNSVGKVRTRDNGAFRFDSVAAGRYTIGARAIGYVSGTGKVAVGADGGTAIIEMIRVLEFTAQNADAFAPEDYLMPGGFASAVRAIKGTFCRASCCATWCIATLSPGALPAWKWLD